MASSDPAGGRLPLAGRNLRSRLVALVGVLILAGSLALAAGSSVAAKTVTRPAQRCQALALPAFFPPQFWNRIPVNGHYPAVIVLNPDNGPGTRYIPQIRTAVRHVRREGSRVLGYIDTAYSRRSLAFVKQAVRDYRQWYGINGMFLDQTPNHGTAQIGYYQRLDRYIRSVIPHPAIWINPGVYPDPAYLSVASVIMTFEGPYSAYKAIQTPAWAHHYPSDRFASDVFATSRPNLARAMGLSKARNTGFIFFTNETVPDPYTNVPSYWRHEVQVVRAGCRAH
jgi:hypothetical protein